MGECILSSAAYGNHILVDRYKSTKTIDRKYNEEFNFDYTVVGGEDIQQTVQKFLKLKSEVMKQHPNAKIHIAGRTIAIDYGDSVSFYCASDGDIVPMVVTSKEKIGFRAEKKAWSIVKGGNNEKKKNGFVQSRQLVLTESNQTNSNSFFGNIKNRIVNFFSKEPDKLEAFDEKIEFICTEKPKVIGVECKNQEGLNAHRIVIASHRKSEQSNASRRELPKDKELNDR